MNILLVDDSKLVRYKLRNMIDTYVEENNIKTYEINEAQDGIEALDTIQKGKTDIVFLDWNMPNLNGVQVVESVRADKEYRKIRIVMTTTEGSKESVKKMIKKGVNGYILKPFKREKIYQVLDALTARLSK